MNIAKIVSSNSHLDYVARVIDSLDAENPPAADDYGFAKFVSINLDSETIVGIIHNSMLLNPEYANFGPRLSPKPDLANFTPDYINEQGILIGILLLGTLGNDKKISHGVPRRVVPPGQEVFGLDGEAVKTFHKDEKGALQIHYYSQVIDHSGAFAVPLLESIIDQLSSDCTLDDANRLKLLKQSLSWQRTLGAMRL